MGLVQLYVELGWRLMGISTEAGEDFQSRFRVFRMSLVLLLSCGKSDRLPLL